MNVRLNELEIADEAEFRAYLSELIERKEAFIPAALGAVDIQVKPFSALVARLREAALGINQPQGWVPDSTYLLKDSDDHILGAINIRHRLTPFLQKVGGHIGYGIRPTYRGNGYGTEILRQGLLKAKILGIHDALLTCDADNAASERVILACGGIYEGEDYQESEGNVVKRFWIKNI